jgi:hypothetical protein
MVNSVTAPWISASSGFSLLPAYVHNCRAGSRGPRTGLDLKGVWYLAPCTMDTEDSLPNGVRETAYMADAGTHGGGTEIWARRSR